MEEIQRIQDEFTRATGVASIITHADGTPITKPSNFCRFCNDIVRKTKKGLANCYRSDACIGRPNLDAPIIQTCLSGGLWDAGASITVGGRHVANWLIGQVRDETQSEEKIRAYAREIGADEEKAAEAFREVTPMPRAQFDRVAQLLFTMSKELSRFAFQNLQQARAITESRRAEALIRAGRHQLFQVIDTVPHMIFAKDRQGRFLLANRAIAEAYQKNPKDLIGVRRQDLHRNLQEMEAFLKVDREVLASGKPRLVSDESFTDGLGRKHALQTIRIPFKMAGMNDDCILGVSVDVTEQKKVEEFRNDIVRTVSHELRTPLSIEKEGISLLIDELVGPVNAQQKEILGTVMRSIDRLARMITSLLDISSIETGKIKLVQKMTDLGDLVKDVAFEFKKRANEKNIDFDVKLPKRRVHVLVDADKITQVLSNLVDNAIKFTPERGAVEVSLVMMKNEVECEIRDSGIGIAPENVKKLFEKFQQFSRTAGPGEKGFGLGLSIARGIVELHGGRIWIKSELGKGARATFSLPLFQKKEG
jgi:PAS domain S-box-containing protein